MTTETTEKLGARSAADDVLAGVDLRGRRFLVTGVSSGLGVETARALAARGADVVGTARDLAKAEGATAGVRAAAKEGGGSFATFDLDLALQRSVRATADRLLADDRQFHAVIANAGVMATPFGRTEDGFEMQFGTNHLGHFVLVNRIASLLADHGRIVNLSSQGHRQADVDLDDPSFERTAYDPWVAYARSKTANVLFSVELDRRHRGRGVRACSVMPGIAWTGLAQHLTPEHLKSISESIAADRAKGGLLPMEFKSVAQAAATSVWAAVVASGEEVGGRYLEDCHVAPIDDGPGFRDGVRSYAVDPERAKLLWAKSEALVGERS